MRDTSHRLFPSDFPPPTRRGVSWLQVNLGYTCNLSCTHCHVNAGPSRTEQASRETLEHILAFCDSHDVTLLDLTGGAPEMNKHFRWLVREARKRDINVIDRCNLTILLEPGQESLVEFLAENKVEVVASLPCYTQDNVDKQRGKGVFDGSIRGLQRLNAYGYGIDSDKKLNLVYNPGGAFLPPPQEALQADYKDFLLKEFDVRFNDLLTITNMPISRFGAVLEAKGEFDSYLSLLKSNFSVANHHEVMCRDLLSIDWQGYVYDCDFNQMLNLPYQHHPNTTLNQRAVIQSDANSLTHISSLIDQAAWSTLIATGEHCYGCTAGQGSSCKGAL